MLWNLTSETFHLLPLLSGAPGPGSAFPMLQWSLRSVMFLCQTKLIEPALCAGGWTRLIASSYRKAWQLWQGTTVRIQLTEASPREGTKWLSQQSIYPLFPQFSHLSSGDDTIFPLLFKGQLKYLEYFLGHQPKELFFLCSSLNVLPGNKALYSGIFSTCCPWPISWSWNQISEL